MKKTIFIAVLSLLAMTACTDKEAAREILLEENFAQQHPEWQIENDTIVKNFTLQMGFGLKKPYPIPFRLTWVNAVDTVNTHAEFSTHYIAYYKMERLGGSDKIQIDNAVADRYALLRYEGENDKAIESISLRLYFHIDKAAELHEILFYANGKCLDTNNEMSPLDE